MSSLSVKDAKVGEAPTVAQPAVGRGRGRAPASQSSVGGLQPQAPPTSAGDAVHHHKIL